MKIINMMGRKVAAAALAVSVMVTGVASVSAASLNKADNDITVYVSVEKSVFNSHPELIETPVKETVPAGSTALYALEKAVGAANVEVKTTSYGNYVTGIADSGNTSATKYITSTTPSLSEYKYAGKVASTDSKLGVSNSWNGTVNKDGWLSEKDYNRNTGWMISVDNTEAYNGVDTTLKDGDVVRMEYTLYGGCDDGWTGYIENSSSNWVSVNAFNTRVDKSALVQAIAETTSSNTGYTKALAVLENLEASTSDVSNAISGLHLTGLAA